MKTIIKKARTEKNLMVREVAQLLGIDQALVSKFESGTRKPTREQVIQLANILDLNAEKLLIEWMKEKIICEIGDDDLALKAIIAAEKQIKYNKKSATQWPHTIQSVLDEIDGLKQELSKIRQYDSYRIAEALELEYTFESNRIEGNTLTLKETDLVINEGLTISGKSMREHLEAINHQEAIHYIKHLINQKTALNERELLSIHNLILRGIDTAHAGRYRNVQVMIRGSSHVPPQPYLVPKQMEDYFIWYQSHKTLLHPVVLAAQMHEKLVTIHPFIDGNGRTSRLVMNLILLRHGLVIANIKGDVKSRMEYYSALEQVQTSGNTEPFIELVAKYELDALQKYIAIIKP
jgi:Fic family protein